MSGTWSAPRIRRPGWRSARPVTDTMRHDTRRLVDITVADGVLSSTAGHRFFVKDRGWTLVSALRVGDSLRTPDGTFRIITAVKDRAGLTPREVYDLRALAFTRSMSAPKVPTLRAFSSTTV